MKTFGTLSLRRRAAAWLGLDSSGEPLGEVELPSHVFVRQVDLPYLWGVETDSLDVPYVVRYRVSTL